MFNIEDVKEDIKKGTRHDKITAEIIKKTGAAGKDMLRKLFSNVWNEEIVPKIGSWELLFQFTRKQTRKTV